MADTSNPLNNLGFLPGQLHLNHFTAPPVPTNMPRPFAPNEYLQNPNGSWSNEMSYTIQDPNLNGGKPTIVPGLWIKDGRAYHATEDEAARFAASSGLMWPTYNRLNEAEAASMEREKNWQKISPQNASSVAPLYVVPNGLFGGSRR